MSEYADADMLDADDQFFHVAQRLIGNIEEGSSPPQDSPPSNAYRHSDYSILTSDQEWPPSSEGHNSIQSFDGVRDVIALFDLPADRIGNAWVSQFEEHSGSPA
ncbi:hypothetical protein N0V85_006731 [Neurospora sp. IMI 360204]|nr:hypothetical protein N0V85_006731 [Neurospora sp. IMI 360204]